MKKGRKTYFSSQIKYVKSLNWGPAQINTKSLNWESVEMYIQVRWGLLVVKNLPLNWGPAEIYIDIISGVVSLSPLQLLPVFIFYLIMSLACSLKKEELTMRQNIWSISVLSGHLLMSQKSTYTAGVMGGYAADALTVMQCKYLKCFLINLAHNEEPSGWHPLTMRDQTQIKFLQISNLWARKTTLRWRRSWRRGRNCWPFSKQWVKFLCGLSCLSWRAFQANQTLACISVHEGPWYRPSWLWHSQSIPDPTLHVNRHFHTETVTKGTCKC